MQLLTLGLWTAWLIFYWWGHWPLAGQSVSELDTALILAIMAAQAVMFITAIAVCFAPAAVASFDLPLAVNLVGMVLLAGGAIGTFYCRRYLGRFWAAEAALQSEHYVIETGPYHYARHPIYTGAVAIGIGAALVFATWWMWAAAAVYTAAYIWKAYLEDHFLAAELPGYDGYRQRVRCLFFPHIW